MPDIVLAADTARPTGSANARRLRHHGRIPGVVYGHGIEATPISVDARALRGVLSTPAGQNVVLELEFDGARHLAMPKVVDHHPVRHTISHVDFVVVNRNQAVTADVPVVTVGEAEQAIRDGGAVDQVLHTLSVSMLPGQIPDAIEVDISGLAIGDTIRVGELRLPAGVTTVVDADTLIVTVSHAAVVEEAAPAEGEEGAEGAAEGEAAAEGGSEESADSE